MTNQTNSYHHGDLRAALLWEAAAMIAEGGVSSVTMRALGLRLGVSRAAPYRHFQDKSELLVAVAAAGFKRLEGRLQTTDEGVQGSGAEGSGVERLRRMGEEYLRFALENPAHYRLMYGEGAVTREDHPQLKEAASALFERFVSVIEAHQRNGSIKREDPRAQAYVAWGAVHGLASLVIEGQIMAAVDVDALILQTTSTLLDGLRPHRSP
jgi:AcrR family transcriptional regulator